MNGKRYGNRRRASGKYTGLETIDLLHIIANKNDFTEIAVFVASEELAKRKAESLEILKVKTAQLL